MSAAPPRRGRWRSVALLLAAVLAAYLNSLWGAFQFDDHNVIVFNPVVHSFEAWRADLGAGIRPLLKLGYTINWTLGPEAPLGFHVFNVAVHAVSTLLVYVLALQLVRSHGGEPDRGAETAALVAALIFALHPVHTEAVTYISGRSSSQMAMFYLAGIVAYIAGTLERRPWLAVVAAPVLFLMAVATKETAVTFPIALLLWEWSRPGPRRRSEWAALARRQATSWIALFAVAAALVLHPVYGTRLAPDLGAEALHRALLSQIDALGHLVSRLWILHPQNIDPELRAVTAWTWAGAARGLMLAAALALGCFAWRTRPWWGFGILWFFLQLAPTNSLLPRLDLANERHLYLADAGLLAALGVELQRWRGFTSLRWARASLAALLVVLAALTVLRNRDYASEVRLWEQTVRVSPQKPRAFNNLGFAYSGAGCLEQAEAAYREAVRLDPRYERARENLAALLARKGTTPSRRCDGG